MISKPHHLVRDAREKQLGRPAVRLGAADRFEQMRDLRIPHAPSAHRAKACGKAGQRPRAPAAERLLEIPVVVLDLGIGDVRACRHEDASGARPGFQKRHDLSRRENSRRFMADREVVGEIECERNPFEQPEVAACHDKVPIERPRVVPAL
ncbi:hypothetical protein QP551_07655 [Slackia exigua]|uniref:hypothetical protein n=1 Tax=Slackia exigua TaxID=84109 RepID=UPI00254D724E|nr:hypothetical protein [Slackia exigua]MDK7724566.1 hypothetical protein [Slackia exigua]MDK7725001.1 hypothetical protein [Slackia exigua]